MLYNLNVFYFGKFSWCSGYHVCLTHRRSQQGYQVKANICKHVTNIIQNMVNIVQKVTNIVQNKANMVQNVTNKNLISHLKLTYMILLFYKWNHCAIIPNLQFALIIF